MGAKNGNTTYIAGEERKRIRVLFTSDSLSIAGIRSIILNLILKLNTKKFESAVAIVKPLKGDDAFYLAELEDRNTPVRSLDLNHPQALFPIGVKRMKKIISSINPDIICTSLLTDCFFVVRAVASMDIPIISFFRGEVDFSNLSRFKRRILLDHLEFSDRIVAFSEQAKKAYPRESTAPITVLPPMIDINRFSPKELRFFGAKEELTIGFIYSSKDEEAVSLLTQVFSAIRKRLPYVKKLIIAFGESGQNAVRRIVAESGVSKWIDIVGPQKDIASIYHRMDFLISIREMQSMGISVLEAMSSRVIPIIGENSLMPDVISNGRNGFFINPRNIDETVRFFEEIFVDCVRNPSKFNRMAKLARETVHEKFSSGTITPLYEELFERLALNRETKK